MAVRWPLARQLSEGQRGRPLWHADRLRVCINAQAGRVRVSKLQLTLAELHLEHSLTESDMLVQTVFCRHHLQVIVEHGTRA